VQWHPEDLVAAGDEQQMGIFRWLADEIKAQM
jgi:gamma-glutamyl-gamma-aminobutyrate hydrolase PuuD